MPQTSNPVARLWLRASDTLPADPGLHRDLLAYLSDYQLVATATLPHGVGRSLFQGEQGSQTDSQPTLASRSCITMGNVVT